jgi:hypothetical protein
MPPARKREDFSRIERSVPVEKPHDAAACMLPQTVEKPGPDRFCLAAVLRK